MISRDKEKSLPSHLIFYEVIRRTRNKLFPKDGFAMY